MACCENNCNNKTEVILSPEFANLPILKYPKEPVQVLNELYVRYPNGGEYGWYAFVTAEGTFAWWNTELEKWSLIPDSILSSVGVDASLMKDGDIAVWDFEAGKFTVFNLSLFGTEQY